MRTSTRFARPTISTRALALTALAIASVAGLPIAALAQAPEAPTTEEARTSQPFRFFWAVETQHDAGRWRDARWAENIDVGNVAVSYDYVFFYQRYLGLAPRAGYHTCQAPGYMAAHLAALATEVDRWIPDPNFEGYVCIEWEYAPFFWIGRSTNPVANDPNAIDRDYGDDWYTYMQQNRSSELVGLTGAELEAYLKQTYEAASRAWFDATMSELRRLRPNAKFSYYNMPNQTYLDYVQPGPNPAKAYNESIPWFWEGIDFTTPVIYQRAYTLSDDSMVADFPNQNRPFDNQRSIRGNIREAKRLAPGKPVVPMVHARYLPTPATSASSSTPPTPTRSSPSRTRKVATAW